jgi:hypothetical protein
MWLLSIDVQYLSDLAEILRLALFRFKLPPSALRPPLILSMCYIELSDRDIPSKDTQLSMSARAIKFVDRTLEAQPRKRKQNRTACEECRKSKVSESKDHNTFSCHIILILFMLRWLMIVRQFSCLYLGTYTF